jgi:hypothetical protein
MLLIPLKRGKLQQSTQTKPFTLFRLFAFLLFVLLGNLAYSQKAIPPAKHALSLSVYAPLGDFSNTHFPGTGLSYSGGDRKTGLLRIKHLGWNYEGGFNYYFGRRETVSGYNYHYRNYSFLFASAGLIFRIKKVTAGAYIGPGLGIYYGNKELNLTIHTALSYRLNKEYDLSLGLFSMQEKKADRLWSGCVRVSRYF